MSEKTIFTHLAARVFNTPLMIHPAKLETILAVIGGRLGLDVSGLRISGDGKPAPMTKAFNIHAARAGKGSAVSSGAVTLAVIPVYGTLVHRAGGLDAMSGLRSYTSIRNDFRQALNDKSVDGILFDIDSPGGEASGLFDLADEIFAARQTKPIQGVANESAFSAAYALGSATSKLYLSRTAGVGSIGVRAVHVDRTGFNDKAGLKFTEMFVGDRKNDFTPNEPLSDAARDVLHKSLVMHYNLFVETVARNRNMKESAVRDTQAGFFEGQDAVTAGLADAVLSWDQAIARMVEDITNSTGGRFMSTQNTGLQHQLEALFKGSSDEETAAALKPLGYIPAASRIDEQAVRDEAKKQGYDEAMAYVKGIYDLCILGGMPQLAGTLIEKKATIEEARKEILDARADADKDSNLNSMVGATTVGAISPLVADAQARADKK